MKIFLSFMIIALSIFASEEQFKHLKDAKEPRILLESIQEHGIKIGDGKLKTCYVFVDPMCPHSKNFIRLITKDPMLQLQNTYYVFLHKLSKFDSAKLIHYIYTAENQEKALTDVMVKNETVVLDNFTLGPKLSENIQNITNVGKSLDIKIRPYEMAFHSGSRYCVVSSGSAPCTEEEDF